MKYFTLNIKTENRNKKIPFGTKNRRTRFLFHTFGPTLPYVFPWRGAGQRDFV